MDWLQFFASVIGSIAWPAAIVILVLLLRRALIGLLPRLMKLRYKDFEAEFAERLDQVEVESADLPRLSLPAQTPNEIAQRLRTSIDLSANTAVFLAWLGVETSLIELAKTLGVLQPNMTAIRVARRLVERKLIDDATYQTIVDMNALRNLAVHPDLSRPIPTDQAERYKKVADRVIAVLESVTQAVREQA